MLFLRLTVTSKKRGTLDAMEMEKGKIGVSVERDKSTGEIWVEKARGSV